ncbi:hypothetical protein R6Y95_08715 [Methanoculleus palmolei]|jgi:hypothetical protein|uniref:Methionine synthase n=1 Tax=Methanoculleus palmolei TaxID=72612 RepID=A0ABD8AAZ8_9EURY|nr:hypothetical protein R6Y95_08715 [Methanoculleus palmolei]
MIPSPGLRATGVGALPHRDPDEACRAVLAAFPEVPYVPTLPTRGLLEAIVFADAEYLPGGVVRDGRLVVDRSIDPSEAMERILLDYLEQNADPYRVGEAYGSGFHAMMGRDLSDALLVKCQVTGPVTFGMQVVDETRRPILYDPEYADLLGKLLGLRARWCEGAMRERMGARATLVVLSDPYLASLGSAVVPVDAGVAASAYEDIAGLLDGGLGIHCCANTDWAFILGLEPAVVSIDAWTYAREFLLYADDVARYMEAGGVVAWGVIPAEYSIFAAEKPDAFFSRFQEIRTRATETIDPDLFDRQSLITPTCGIRNANEEEAVAIMAATASLSRRLRGEGP